MEFINSSPAFKVPVEVEEAPQPPSRRGSRRGKKTSTPPSVSVAAAAAAAAAAATEAGIGVDPAPMEEGEGEAAFTVKAAAHDKMTESKSESITAANGRLIEPSRSFSVSVCLTSCLSLWLSV